MKYILRRPSSLWNIRIPTILALVLLLGGLGTAGFLMTTTTVFRSGASGSDVPQNLHVSNITSSSFTISYTTDAPTLGTISYGKDRTLGTIILDDRDQGGNIPHPYSTHSITIRNLLPSSSYYFTITSGNSSYSNNNTPYSVTTGPVVATVSLLNEILSGTVINSGTTGNDVLVYLQPQNGQILSTLTDQQGKYRISLAKLRTTDLLQYATIASSDTVTLIVSNGTAISHVTTLLGNTTIPAITLGQDYDFTISSQPL